MMRLLEVGGGINHPIHPSTPPFKHDVKSPAAGYAMLWTMNATEGRSLSHLYVLNE
jgi:hypothetical protein